MSEVKQGPPVTAGTGVNRSIIIIYEALCVTGHSKIE